MMIIDPIDLERSSLVILWPIKIPTSISFPWVYNTSMVQLTVCFDEGESGNNLGYCTHCVQM